MRSSSIAIVLVGPQGDANIGATARAMKNFGFFDLRLVQAVPHQTKAAYMWAVDARDVLDGARCFPSLAEALSDRSVAVAFTRRLGKLRRCRMTNAELPAWLEDRAGAALVFGREDRGLSNDEVRQCDAIITIPSARKLPSLNLAQSVMIACSELFLWKRRKAPRSRQRTAVKFVPRREAARLLARLERMLERIGYDDRPPTRLRSRILFQMGQLFGRAGLAGRDIRMFEGLIGQLDRIFPLKK